MKELKLLTHSFSTPKTLDDIYFISKIGELSFHNMFCSGLCTEATCFEDLCGACLTEYHEYKESHNEV